MSAIRKVLSNLPAHGGETLELGMKREDQKAVLRLGDICKDLVPLKLVTRTDEDLWEPTPEAAHWMQSDDVDYLARLLHAHVKFFGEILGAISEHGTHADLLRCARETYDLPWNSYDQLRRRTGWLRSFGYIELWGQKIVLTQSGSQAAEYFTKLTPPTQAALYEDASEEQSSEDVPTFIHQAIAQLDTASLSKRRRIIGYIARGQRAVGRRVPRNSEVTCFDALRRLVSVFENQLSVDVFQEECVTKLKIKPGSALQSLHALKHMGLVEQVGPADYIGTKEGKILLESGRELAFVYYMHTRYRFVLEILQLLDTPHTTSEITRKANELFGLHWPSHETETRTRLEMLAGAGLVKRRDWQRYEVTSKGKKARAKLPLEPILDDSERRADEDTITGSGATRASEAVGTVISDLRAYSILPEESRNFEAVVANAFKYLGFSVEHIGGPAATDVLVTADLPPAERYRMSVDAKTASSGSVGENNIRFEALKEHRTRHNADHIVVVGPEFEKRVRRWAADHRVTLISVAELTSLLDLHQRTPMTLLDLKEVFEDEGSILEAAEGKIGPVQENVTLASAILSLVDHEANNDMPIEDGVITIGNLQYALRGSGIQATAIQIEEVISFLEHPLIGAVATVAKDKVKLADSPANVSLRLRGLATILAGSEK